MTDQKIRFYLDENMPVELAEQLRRRGIDAITVRDLGKLGDDDRVHLRRAAEQGRVLCTYDKDYIRQTALNMQESYFGLKEIHTIGRWVNRLQNMYENYVMADMENHVEYL